MSKISSKRLYVNSEKKKDHEAWSTFGLGLQDSDGAVKREFVDLDTSQASVGFAVDFSLHRRANEEILDEIPHPEQLDVHTRTCLDLFGHCKQQTHHALAKCFAKTFGDLTSSKKLATGTLVRFKPVGTSAAGSSNDPAPKEEFYFTGVLCKKPFLQVLAKAWPKNSCLPSVKSFSLIDASSAIRVPTFVTSYDAFRDIAEGCHGTLEGIAVSIFPSTFELDLWGLKLLQVTTADAPVEHFMKSGASPVSQRVQVQLPFGLKAPQKKRAPKRREKKVRKTRAKKATAKVFIVPSASGSDSSESSAAPDYVFEPEAASKNGLDTEIEAGANDLEFQAGAAGESLLESDEEIAKDSLPPTIVAAKEAEAACTAFQEYQDDADDREFLTEVAQRQSKAAGTVRSSFFNKFIGFKSEAGFAPSGRSRCYHCNQCISKGSIRYTYLWSLSRPERYMHGACVAPFVEADVTGRKTQAIEATNQIIIAQSEDLVIKNGTDKVLAELLKL